MKDNNEFILSHLTPQDGSILHKVACRPVVLQEVLRILEQKDKSAIPYLFFKNEAGYSPLDLAVANNCFQSINLLIQFLVKFYNNPNFNFIIDSHINTLIAKGINLDRYFQSKLPLVRINNKEFP